MACFAFKPHLHLCRLKLNHRRWNPVFLCSILLRWSNRGWSLPLALELAPMPSWKRHGEPKITCCAAEIPTWRPMGDAIVIRSWVPRFSVEPRRPAAILLSNYPHDLMVKVLSHGFLPLNLAAYLSEGWLAKVEGVETNPWVRFDPFCIWVREKKRYAGGETDLDTGNWLMSILHSIVYHYAIAVSAQDMNVIEY